MSCETDTIYTSMFGSESDMSTVAIVLTCVLLPIQLILLVCINVKGYACLQKDRIYTEDRKKEGEEREQVDEKVEKNCSEGFCLKVSKYKFILFFVCTLVFYVASFAMLVLATMSVYQAIVYTYEYGECELSSRVDSFTLGDDNWIGLDFMTPNLTKLDLDLNTRIKVSRNAILGLLLNGTVATFPPGIGFANQTSIGVTFNSSSTFVVTTTNVQTYIDAALRQWLSRNTSLSGDHPFPICQNGTVNLPHPVFTSETIQLDYMDDICGNLTSEVNELVGNGQSVDSLLSHLLSVQGQKTSIEENLTSLNSTLASISLRSNQYTQNLSSVGIDETFVKAVPLLLLGVNIIMFMLTFIYFCVQYYKNKEVKLKKHVDEDSDEESESSSESSLSDIEMQRKKKRKKEKRREREERKKYPKLLSPRYSKCLMIWGFVVNILVGLSGYFFAQALLFASQSCTLFDTARTNITIFNEASLTNADLLSPIQECTSGENTYFLEQSDTATQHTNIQQLYQISSLYNDSVPLAVLNSHSIEQIQILKGFVQHMETMPIKSQDFTLTSILQTLNTFTNGSHADSEQVKQCGSSVLSDQYVFNSVECDFQLIDYANEPLTTQARCLQIPTFDGTSGTNQTDLNQVQHTIVLNSTCPTMQNFFDGSNTNCFLGMRLQLLRDAGCNDVADSISERIANLVSFSIETGTYTDVYLQNLRNFFGVYAVMNTNLSDFFTGTNMSQTLDEFGTFSHNLLNKTSCSYINSQTDAIFNAYCPTINSMSSLFFDSFAWIYFAVAFSFLQMLLFYAADFSGRVIYHYKLSVVINKLQMIDQLKSSSKKLEESQQSLRQHSMERNQAERQAVIFGVINQNEPQNRNQVIPNVKVQDSESSSHCSTVQYNREIIKDDYKTNKKVNNRPEVNETDVRQQFMEESLIRESNTRYQKHSAVLPEKKYASADQRRKPAFFQEKQKNENRPNYDLEEIETPPRTPAKQKIQENVDDEVFYGQDLPHRQNNTSKKNKVSRVSKLGEEENRVKIIELGSIIEKTINLVDVPLEKESQ